MRDPSNKQKPIFAIYKNGAHLGNERGNTEIESIKNYIINSYLKSFLKDDKLLSKYSARIAVKGIDYY